MENAERNAEVESEQWLHIATIEVAVSMLSEDTCQVSLERGPESDTLHLRHDECGDLDRDLELPATPGSDVDASRAALANAARAGAFNLRSVLAPGILGIEECRRIIDEGDAAWLAHREAERQAGRDAEARQPSRIIQAARELGLGPEPVGPQKWVARCPGTNHSVMISPRGEQFGCGYCKVKGGPEELRDFVDRRRVARSR